MGWVATRIGTEFFLCRPTQEANRLLSQRSTSPTCRLKTVTTDPSHNFSPIPGVLFRCHISTKYLVRGRRILVLHISQDPTKFCFCSYVTADSTYLRLHPSLDISRAGSQVPEHYTYDGTIIRELKHEQMQCIIFPVYVATASPCIANHLALALPQCNHHTFPLCKAFRDI